MRNIIQLLGIGLTACFLAAPAAQAQVKLNADNIDEVIAIIKQSADKNVACEKLMQAFELSDKQANAILEMRLQRLTSLEVEKLQEELREASVLVGFAVKRRTRWTKRVFLKPWRRFIKRSKSNSYLFHSLLCLLGFFTERSLL